MKHLSLPKPADIILPDNHLYGTYGNYESEVSARWIIKFCQDAGDWISFTQAEIDKFSKHDFWFNNLIEDSYIEKNGDQYSVTLSFVAQLQEYVKQELPSTSATKEHDDE